MERRLSAILAPDVAGYSRLMGEDVKASRDTGQGVHKSRRLHGSVAVSGWRPGQDRGLSQCRQRIAVLELGSSK